MTTTFMDGQTMSAINTVLSLNGKTPVLTTGFTASYAILEIQPILDSKPAFWFSTLVKTPQTPIYPYWTSSTS